MIISFNIIIIIIIKLLSSKKYPLLVQVKK